MNHFSRFSRALSPICAVFIAGAALVSGRPALAATPSFNLTPASQVFQPRTARGAFVPVGIAPASPAPAAASSSTGGFSTLIGPTTPSPGGFRLVQATAITVQFEKASYEVTEGQPSITVALIRTGDTSGRTIVTITPTDGAAVQGQDYTAMTTSPAFAPGVKRITVDIPIIDDAISESQETFRLTLSNPTTIPTATTTLGTNITTDVTIDDNDSAIQFAQTTLTVPETNATLNLTVSRTGITTGPATVNYAFADGTATNGSDYTGQNGSITFAANQTSATVNVGINADTIDEIDEDFSVILSIPRNNRNTGIVTNGGTETITITDDDSTLVGIQSGTYQVNEGDGTVSFTVVRSGDLSRPIDVDYQTIDGSATDGDDYTGDAETLHFEAGAANASQTVSIPILNDTTPENTEDFQVLLSNPVFNPPLDQKIPITVSPNSTATISILDDDPAVNIAATAYSVNEADGTANITLQRSGPTTASATVTYAITNGTATAGADFTVPTNQTVTFAAGVATQTITIPIINDTANEDAETFTLTLTAATGTVIGPNSTTTVTIIDNDAIPTITIADVSQVEGNPSTTTPATPPNNLVFTVTLSAVSGKDVVVTYMTQDATATDGYTSTGTKSVTEDTDYIAQPSPPTTTLPTVTIKAGSSSATITVPIVPDTKFESDESLVVALTAATNATIDRRKAVGTIINDDAAPASTFAISPTAVSVAENVASGNITLTVTRTGDTTTAASVTVATADGTAKAGADYTAIAPTVLNFGVGVTAQTVTIPISNDSVNEADETFTATLSAAQGFATVATDGTGTATVTITNDDAVPTLTIAPASVTEGDSGTANLVFQATLDASSEQTITVQYATADGTATAGSDYVAQTGTLTFAPGDRSKTITVVVNGDTDIESDETLSLNLSGAQNVTLSASSVTGTIVNDDTAPTVSNVAFASTTASVTEGTPSVTLTVQRTTGSDRVASINYATADGTATAGSDYTATSGTLNFAVGQTSATITVPITDDTLQELGSPETFTVTLSNPGGNAVLPAQTTATVSITDNDGTPTLSVANTSVAEGDSGNTAMVFTVSLSPQSQSTVTVQIATTTDGTATSADFRAGTATLTFAPGVATQTFTVNVKGDTIVEPDETVIVRLSNAQGASIDSGGTTATGTIVNDDVPGGGGTISFLSASYAANENAVNTGQTPLNSVTITLGRTGNVDLINKQSATVRFVTGSGTATPNKDYRPVNKTVTFAAGETTASVIVPLINDNLFEPDENVSLLISTPSNNAILGAITRATLTITDDDPQSAVPRADSITPTNPVGSPFTVQATYSSDFGVNVLNPVLIQIGGTANGSGLRALYVPKTNLLSLDTTPGQTAKPGSKVLLTNQFGSLDASQTKVQRSGNSITVTWTLRLTSKTALPIYIGATGSSGQSVFVRKGTWRPASTSASSTNNS